MSSEKPGRGALERARRELEARLGGLLAESGDRGIDQLIESASRPLPAELAEAEGDPQRLLGRYLLIRRIGHGAMAAVWKAWDRELARWVAVKLLQDPDATSHRERFLREATAAASLKHPNLVTVHDAGDYQGRLFLVMEFIDGKPLSVREALPQIVATLAKVADGLEEAHRNGIVHRDVKPGNIVVDTAGEPHVVDFGLVHLVGDRVRITRTGAVVGTPVYMAPEQVAGRSEAIGPATDVYALGAILYEALAGRPPHAGDSATEIYGRILSDDPVAPRSLNAGAPADLETICLKALEKEPSRRYPSAGAMAEDLRRYLAGEPVAARRASMVYRCRRWMVRRRIALGIATAGAAAVIVVAAIFGAKLSESRRVLALWSGISHILQEAELLARAGEVAEARKKLDAGIGLCRSHFAQGELAHGRYFLGRLLRARGDVEESERELTRALEVDSGLGEARLERGLLRADRYAVRLRQARIKLFRERGGRDADRIPTAGEVAGLHPELEASRQEAIADLAAAGGRSSYFRPVDALYGRAELAAMRGEEDLARDLLDQVVQSDPLHAKAFALLAELCDRRGDAEQEIRHLTTAIDRHKGLVEAFVNRCMTYRFLAMGQPGSPQAPEWRRLALKDAERAVEIGGRVSYIYTERAGIRLELGDAAGAIADFSTALEIDPGSAVGYLDRGWARDASGDPDGAIADYTEGIRRDPDLVFGWNLRGLVRARKQDYRGAIGDFEEVLRRRPGDPAALLNRGRARLDLGSVDEAILDFDEVIRSGHRPDLAYNNLGRANYAKGDYDRAIDAYGKCLELNPALDAPWFGRAHCHRMRGDLDAAARDFAAATERNPRFVAAFAYLGTVRKARHESLRSRGLHAEAEAERAAAIRACEKALDLGIPDALLRRQVEEALRGLRGEY